jgi:YbbR domain-containing protein
MVGEMKKIVTLLFAFMLVIAVAGCVGNTVTAHTTTADDANPDSIVVREPVIVTYDSDDEDTGLNSSGISFITF